MEAVKGIGGAAGTGLPLGDLQGRNGANFALMNNVARVSLREMTALATSQASASQRLLALSIVTALVALGLTIGGYLIAVRRISAPIRSMTEAMRRLAAHDLTA